MNNAAPFFLVFCGSSAVEDADFSLGLNILACYHVLYVLIM